MSSIELSQWSGIAVAIVSIIGMFLTIMNLPGNWVILIAAMVYGYFTDFNKFTLGFLGFMTLLVLIGELVEFIAGILGAKKAKASRVTTVMTLVGSILGTMVGTAIMPVIGSFFGALAGVLVFSFVSEYLKIKSGRQAARVASYAFFGQLMGMVVKWLVAVIMLISLLKMLI